MSSADLSSLEKTIETAFDNRDSVTISTKGEIRDAVEQSLNLLDAGGYAGREPRRVHADYEQLWRSTLRSAARWARRSPGRTACRASRREAGGSDRSP